MATLLRRRINRVRACLQAQKRKVDCMLNDRLPFSQACENNKEPILKVLKEYISDQESLLEIAGGTGQHGEFFAKSFPNLLWQTSDLPGAVADLNLRISEAGLQIYPQL